MPVLFSLFKVVCIWSAWKIDTLATMKHRKAAIRNWNTMRLGTMYHCFVGADRISLELLAGVVGFALLIAPDFLGLANVVVTV